MAEYLEVLRNSDGYRLHGQCLRRATFDNPGPRCYGVPQDFELVNVGRHDEPEWGLKGAFYGLCLRPLEEAHVCHRPVLSPQEVTEVKGLFERCYKNMKRRKNVVPMSPDVCSYVPGRGIRFVWPAKPKSASTPFLQVAFTGLDMTIIVPPDVEFNREMMTCACAVQRHGPLQCQRKETTRGNAYHFCTAATRYPWVFNISDARVHVVLTCPYDHGGNNGYLFSWVATEELTPFVGPVVECLDPLLKDLDQDEDEKGAASAAAAASLDSEDESGDPMDVEGAALLLSSDENHFQPPVGFSSMSGDRMDAILFLSDENRFKPPAGVDRQSSFLTQTASATSPAMDEVRVKSCHNGTAFQFFFNNRVALAYVDTEHNCLYLSDRDHWRAYRVSNIWEQFDPDYMPKLEPILLGHPSPLPPLPDLYEIEKMSPDETLAYLAERGIRLTLDHADMGIGAAIYFPDPC